MENSFRKRALVTGATLAALTIGGISVGSIASAQSYGDGDTTGQGDGAPSASDFQTGATNDLVPVQDADGENPEAEAPEGEREGPRRGHRGGCNLEDAAAAIGIEESALREALDGGQSIADVAEANGVDVQTVIDAMVAAKSERLAEKVQEGRLSQEEADEKLADLESRITDRVNGNEDAPQS